jgi:uncharacterized membrane protein
MWILQWLPDWIFYGIFFAGLLGLLATYIMKFIPLVYVYRTPIQAVSVLAIAIGTYMSGAISNEESWQARVKEMEAKVAAAEVQSVKENIKIVEKVVTKTQIVRTRGQDIIQYVDREIVKYDTKFAPGGVCEIPKEFIKALNDAAEAPK